MKKKLIAEILLTSTLLIGCNRQILDTTWNFNKAIIVIGYEKIAIKVAS